MENYQLVPICDRYPLNRKEHPDTFHIIVDLSNTDIFYEVGDCLAIKPQNESQLVESIIVALGKSGDQPIKMRHGQTVSLRFFLTHHAELYKIPGKLLALTQADIDVKEYQQSHTILDFLKDFAHKISLQDFCSSLQPLLPRFYSIASSMKVVGKEAHLTVKVNQYQIGSHAFTGICSSFLCHRVEIGDPVVAIYHHQSPHFHLNENSFNQPIIMIGPGTGIAPFRGFMQERIARNASKNWLFFGEKNRSCDFFYEDFWTSLVNDGALKLDCAFSRDGEHKVYVQDKLYENKKAIWSWLQSGAYMFVCGDASRMAKDVDQRLQQIIEEEGSMSTQDARNYLKTLRKTGRYLRDVY